jgi:hypothetical protein
LVAIEIPAAVEVISANSFAECGSLASVRFACGSKLSRIEHFAFAWAGTAHFAIPGGVSFVSGSAFGPIQPDSITFSSRAIHLYVSDSFVTDLSGRALVRSFGPDAEIAVGPQIEVIRDGCFSWCASLEVVTFEGELSRLGEAPLLSERIDRDCDSKLC